MFSEKDDTTPLGWVAYGFGHTHGDVSSIISALYVEDANGFEYL